MDNKDKRRLILILVFFLIVVVSIPLAMDHFIIGNNIPSNIPNEGWVSFFGSYFGGIIGAIASMCGIILTINYSIRQNKGDHALQVRPYCIIDYSTLKGAYLLGNINVECCEDNATSASSQKGYIKLKNIGLGPAIKITIDTSIEAVTSDNYPISCSISKDESLDDIANTLQVDKDISLLVHLKANLQSITEDDVDIYTTPDGSTKYSLKEQVKNKYEGFDIIINIKYKDLLENTFSQKVLLNVSFTPQYDCDPYIRKGDFRCHLTLKEASPPILLHV